MYLRFLIGVFIAAFGLLASCQPKEIAQDFRTLDGRWRYDSTYVFPFEITDTTRSYHLYYLLRNTQNYTYSNLFLRYKLTGPDSSFRFDERLKENYLFDPVTGEPFGRGIADLYEHEFRLLKDFRFAKAGRYALHLRQYMRTDTLTEVQAVGFRLTDAAQDQ